MTDDDLLAAWQEMEDAIPMGRQVARRAFNEGRDEWTSFSALPDRRLR